ncbi:helix-turn-helix domain-containing protein [Francisella philomiragia]|uniref:helix-turn-helix domain-containing protein n=1 Tax=Francisella philomiragia TaxID=28110 RepID=UPI001904C68B|nr:helix-turn-helix transcriptional regulator [Francisella philomiragia]MBK2297337.1 helix-turn-helix transcriptional regulator [Francisella philomiragia]
MSLLDKIKFRRKELKLTQKDMESRISMSRQQYQKLESSGNPRLDTLELIAAGLNAEICLIPKEKLLQVNKILGENVTEKDTNPWEDIFGDSDD